MKISWKLVAILTGAIALFPSPALANAGTPLMWTGFMHLSIGNAIIGYLEGVLLSKIFHPPHGKATGVLIFANYASAWGGMFLFVNRLSQISNITIENVHIWFWLFVFAAFVLTVLIEYPFFWVLLRKQQRAIQKALKATLIINGISYLLLFGWYGLNSQTSMLTQLEIVPAAQLQPSKNYVLYFMTSDGDRAIRSTLEGTQQKPIKVSDFELLLPYREFDFGPVPKLTENTDWDYYVSVWAADGITGYSKSEDLKFGFSLETPFVFWRVSNATHLKGDFVVFQLGADQICILHPQQKKLALIARGSQPVVKPKM